MKTLRNSLFIPTPGIEELSNYYIVQRLICERIRSVLLGEPFHDNSKELVAQHLQIPMHLKSENEIQKFVETEARAAMAAFKKYEMTPAYEECIGLLRQYEGKTFQIASVTLPGIMVLLETEQ